MLNNIRRTWGKTLGIAVAACGLGIHPLGAVANDSLTIPSKAPYEKGAAVPEAVRAECGLEQKVPEYVKDAVGKNYQVKTANSVSGKTPGKALDLTINGVLAPGGGPWSGPKSVTVRGTLWENGKQIGNFTASRYTTKGHGTCSMLQRDAKEIASDIAKWLGSPGKDDKLGDAKK